MAEKSPQKNFRVIIVGGAIAGLTLAHCLKRENVDFVVLESRDEIAPQVGASIGVSGGGSRILDQLGLFDDVVEATEPLHTDYYWTEHGKLITTNHATKVIHERHGYPIAFLDRQALLSILYKRLKEDQSKVLLKKEVIKVEHSASGVVVHCADETQYAGDLVVGADGIRSKIRQEMWRHMESLHRGDVIKREQAKMTVDYSCVFGISNAVAGMTAGELHRTYAKGFSILCVLGKNDRIYWFLFQKLDKTCSSSNIPRYTRQDLEETVARYQDKHVTGDVTFGTVYQNVVSTTYVPIEEAFYKHWVHDRFVCLGDSIHKMTPNMGAGGMAAIESVASLTNHLSSLLRSSSSHSLEDIRRCLSTWETARQPRTKGIWARSNDLTRIEAMATVKDRLIALHVLPLFSLYFTDQASGSIIASERLDCIPAPKRSLECSMPFDNQYRHIQDEPFWKRLIWALPLLICLLGAHTTMDATAEKYIPLLVSVLTGGKWEASNGELMDLNQPQYNWNYLDNLFRPAITSFLPSITGSDPKSHLQMITFITDVGTVYGIWLLESYRRAHHWMAVFPPLLFAILYQFKGIGLVAPYYFLWDFLSSPLSKILIADRREVRIRAAKTLLPALLLGNFLPTWGNFFAPALPTRQWINAIWQLFPLLVLMIQFPLMLVTSEPTFVKLKNNSLYKRADIFYVRFFWITLSIISGLTFLYVRFSVPEGSSLFSIFFPGLWDFALPTESFTDCIALFLKYDEIFGIGTGLVWLVLCFRDLKLYGKQVSLLKVIAALAVTTYAVGPGAAFALGWGWREEILADVRR